MRTINRWYLNYVRELTSGELEEMIDFRFTDGSYGRMRREEMLAHVIVHSASHRGGIGALLPEIATTSERDVFAGYLHRTEPERRRKL
ncbi:DinB family protein [Oryzifoliimicrobium ureilyticus]|uniref:DinB family protein n=1 Tax=Oryzifoliimicrobium ureilyticus TaxID=3113724 RepID=UPI003075F3E9